MPGAIDTSAASQCDGGAGGLSGETLLVGRMLRRDFEKFGVHLPADGQARLARLTAAALQLGMRFGARQPPACVRLEIPRCVRSARMFLFVHCGSCSEARQGLGSPLPLRVY